MSARSETKAKHIRGRLLDYASFDGMSWPLPTLELLDRINGSEDGAMLAAAAVVAAYHQMVFDPEYKRRKVIRALRGLRRDEGEPR